MQLSQQAGSTLSDTRSANTYLIVRLGEQEVAIRASRVMQLLLMPDVTAMPKAPPEVRGMINVRGQVIPLIDLRIKLGMPSFVQEVEQINQLLNEREQDHKNWIATLEKSVEQKQPFTLARDPHKCKFGVWYDTYKPRNSSVAFLSLWRSLDDPHKGIHAIADHVCALAAKEDFAGARALIDHTRNGHLKDIIRLFEEVRVMLRQTTREVAVLLGQSNRQIAISADEVTAIEALDESTLKPLSEIMLERHASITPMVAQRRGADHVTMILDTDPLFQGADALAAAAA